MQRCKQHKTPSNHHRPSSCSPSVRDNCSFALDPCRTLRLEVSEVRLSSQETASWTTSYLWCNAAINTRLRQTITDLALSPSVRDNCSFALDPCRTLRLEVSKVRLSSQETASWTTSYLWCNAAIKTRLRQTITHLALALHQSGITVLSHWTLAGPSD